MNRNSSAPSMDSWFVAKRSENSKHYTNIADEQTNISFKFLYQTIILVSNNLEKFYLFSGFLLSIHFSPEIGKAMLMGE